MTLTLTIPVLYMFEKDFPHNREEEKDLGLYFNLANHKLYSSDELKEFCSDCKIFIKMRQTSKKDIIISFLKKNGFKEETNYDNKELFAFFHSFIWTSEKTIKVDEWEIFEQTVLLETAVRWAKRNNISYELSEELKELNVKPWF